MIDRPKEIQTLQAGRAFAALAVLFYHAEITLGLPKYIGHEIVPAAKAADSGVHFFFVISGFIMAYMHAAEPSSLQSFKEFAWKRARRIFPPLWAALTFALALLFVTNHFTLDAAWLSIASAYFALPQETQPLLAVEWTLSHELLFYSLFAVTLLSKKLGYLAIAAWFGLSLTLGVSGYGTPLQTLFSHYNILFVFGIAAAALLRTGFVRFSAAAVAFGIILRVAAWISVASGKMQSHDLSAVLAFGGADALIVFGLAGCESLYRFSVGKIPKYIGDASYSIYLVHFLFVSAACKLIVVAERFIGIPDVVAYMLVVGIGLAGGVVFYECVERPIMRMTPRSLKRREHLAHSSHSS
ncbi:acyltransferase family protein [Caulobacter vibrioides]|uniref:acyltransferase family protein n=1 Tax=Caulobacter vibrioides TaxID=155892 RepID=UPI000BB491F2|nr:acyltransferase [Caulobacter vibrioides]ATC23457.1 acyltransferase [Caulobacter vibrioides]PLR11956.1 acyltransferase [Caulobacter vibrioides]